MRYETKNSFGKRMVRESKIKEIGQGGGTTYTAGDGIDITENEISLANPINELTAYTINTEGVYIKYGEDDIMNIHSGSTTNLIYFGDTSKPLEITNYKDAAIRLDPIGLVSIRTVDGQTTTTYTFKADGIYIGETKITN